MLEMSESSQTLYKMKDFLKEIRDGDRRRSYRKRRSRHGSRNPFSIFVYSARRLLDEAQTRSST